MSDDEIDRMDVARHLLPPPGGEVVGQLIVEVRHLREAIRRLADQDATLSVVGGNVIVEMDATPEMLERFAQRGGPLVPFELPQPTLTNAERKTLEWAIMSLSNSSGARVGVAMDNALAAQQLRKLLERLGGKRKGVEE
jgi:hypothetical protein